MGTVSKPFIEAQRHGHEFRRNRQRIGADGEQQTSECFSRKCVIPSEAFEGNDSERPDIRAMVHDASA
jgi:hypothetical protein